MEEEYIRKNPDKVNWINISYHKKLSEDFIREFQDKVDWSNISINQKLSENFIREFQDKVDWYYIIQHQTLSEPFIREFKDKINWDNISFDQTLSENFIRDFQNKISWFIVSQYQQLSEDFIREFQAKVDWSNISYAQKLSKEFIKEFREYVNEHIQFKTHHHMLNLQGKQELVKNYCEKYNLTYDDKYLYAYRDHNINGSGMFNKTIKYEKNKYYKDWRCNLNPKDPNSFGFGIFPRGNIKVKVKIKDIGCWVDDSNKLRVWGFEII